MIRFRGHYWFYSRLFVSRLEICTSVIVQIGISGETPRTIQLRLQPRLETNTPIADRSWQSGWLRRGYLMLHSLGRPLKPRSAVDLIWTPSNTECRASRHPSSTWSVVANAASGMISYFLMARSSLSSEPSVLRKYYPTSQKLVETVSIRPQIPPFRCTSGGVHIIRPYKP